MQMEIAVVVAAADSWMGNTSHSALPICSKEGWAWNALGMSATVTNGFQISKEDIGKWSNSTLLLMAVQVTIRFLGPVPCTTVLKLPPKRASNICGRETAIRMNTTLTIIKTRMGYFPTPRFSRGRTAHPCQVTALGLRT